ncbi:SusC/RagA family TonB-linked outer membrane protein [uncultured Bacteroides sp.]|uniref:SusC/RagA family TonB-linked outer membrane protein n=1 Tax=uncultured Bacteroides sp. TaxID=162156 RepID=UPI002AABA0CC|nr:SusC/RagA family TonB-linked outer membrane protein [uncultured Bacteroides sp.]
MKKRIIQAVYSSKYLKQLIFHHLAVKSRYKHICLILSLAFISQLYFITTVQAQSLDGKITFELQSKTLQQGLNELGKLSGFRIAYSIPQVSVYTNISIEKETRSVDATLKLLLSKTNLSYTVKLNTIIITSQKSKKTGKKRRITGTISDKDDIPIPGVTIKAIDSNEGSISDVNGYYSIEVPEKSTLQYSFIGMNPIIENIGKRTVINIRMEEGVTELQGVEIVSTGYQSISKERATGSFSQVTAKDLKQTPAINIMEKLEGSTPGVNFNIRENKISIRGQNTYGAIGSSTPLIVIDGFPAIDQELTQRMNSLSTGGAILSKINADDIESITILKDAAATSIWGAKAANGVIVIETKKGKKGKPTINFDTSLSISSPANFKKLDRMNSAQYIDLERELKEKGYISDPNTYNSSWMTFNQNKPVSDALEWMFKVDRGTATEEERDQALDALSKIDNSSQIKKYILQNAVSQQYNLSLSGGGDNNTYYISSNYSKDIPVFRSNKAESYFLTANLNHSFLDNRINLTTNISYNYSNSKSNLAAVNALSSSTFGLRPYDLLVDADGNTIQRSLEFTQNVADYFLDKGYLPWTYNAVDELNYSNSISKKNYLRIGANLNAKLTYWANLSLGASIQKTDGTTNMLDELNSYYGRNLVNTGTSINSGQLIYGVPYGGHLRTFYNESNNLSFRGQLNINKSWNKKISLAFLAGSEIRDSKETSYHQNRYGFDEDTYIAKSYDPSVSYMTAYGWTQTLGYDDSNINRSNNRFLSFYSNAALGFLDEKYILSGSVRFDDYTLAGYSRSQRAKPLWSTGVKWNLKSEDFMESIHWINSLALRASVGTAGSIPTGSSNIAIMTISGNDYYTNETYASILTPADSQVSWEKTTSFNLGIDWGIFNNRLRGTFDIYSKRIKNILYALPVNPTYGWSNLEKNGATMSGHGLELGLSGKIFTSHDFDWTSSFNFSYNTNKVTDSRFAKSASYSLVESATPTVGLPIDYIYAYRWAGLDEKGQSQIYNSKGEIISSTTSSLNITSEDLKYVGRTTPPYFGGFTNTFRYKDFTLNAQIVYAMGHYFRRPSVNYYPQYSGTYSGVIGTQKDLTLRWREAGDEAYTNVPGLENINYNSISRYRSSDILTESASNIKLRQISLNYNFPSELLLKTPFKSVTAGFTVRNLGILWAANKKGIDPDYVATKDYNNLPPAKNYYFTLNISL